MLGRFFRFQLGGISIAIVLHFILEYFGGVRVPVVNTGYAKYQGSLSSSGNTAIFYGISYAEPPVGKFRFRKTQPLNTANPVLRKGVIQATNPPLFCIQFSGRAGVREGGGTEDCLKLNIYTPNSSIQKKTSPKLPVLVYIHGGGYLMGNPPNWPFNHWVENNPDIVVVSIYYRLGLFGFLSAPNPDGALDFNAGFWDQLEALKWIHEHIASFGGDPEQITINGQSAGASSVALHILHQKDDRKLFHKAIAQSVYRPEMIRVDASKEHFEWIVEQTGCSDAGSKNSEKIECLRGLRVKDLVHASEVDHPKNFGGRYAPVVDNVLFNDYPSRLFSKGYFSKVPLMVGSTTDETFVTSEDLAEALRYWYPALSNGDIKALDKFYKLDDYSGEMGQKLSVMIGDIVNRCGGKLLADVHSKAGKPVYAYRFNQPNPTQENDVDKVQHSADNWWMFNGTNTGTNGTTTFTGFTDTAQESFATELISYWVSFVRSGDPNTYSASGAPRWPVWKDSKHTSRRLVLQEGALSGDNYVSSSWVEAEPIKEAERCAFVNKMGHKFGI